MATVPINDPSTIYYEIARASTTEEWRRLNNRLHDELERRIAQVAPRDLDTDARLCELNALCTLSHEIVTMRTKGEELLGLRPR